MRRQGLGFPQALRLAANTVGISIPERVYQPSAGEPAPQRGEIDPSRYRSLTVGSKAYRYLTESRKLDAGLLVDYGVGETADGEAYAFAYKWRPAGWNADRAPKFEFAKVV